MAMWIMVLTVPAIHISMVYDANINGANLIVTTGVLDEAIAHVASSEEATDKWFRDDVLTCVLKGVRFRYICVGNEAVPGVVQSLVLQAIVNLYNAVRKANIDYIQVTTAVRGKVLESSYPPSNCRFAHGVDKITNKSRKLVFIDGNIGYYNLFDAMVDAFVAAMVRAVQKEDVRLVVARTGWPTAGVIAKLHFILCKKTSEHGGWW
ncbi:hypothetical protein OIU77_014499 [Salix suchowensis]|uniref:glucan endo-1,3-beta-D-glucosidase n=1 Tax=Salix suchowensis TaxID=1278906 RepID=A0ABQ8ZXW5_9ROSI|nr:hypothetical protein OIU77_014499 [Salix suchowensis]KAJ6356451.1 hypothetical protein OIU78_004534 [Salix suchowensis]